MTEPPLLSVVDLEAGYGSSRVLFGVSLNVAKGEVVTLLGRNGMGKTTTILSIMGIVASTRGQIIFDGTTFTGLPSFRIARHGVGLVPEGRQIFPNLTVRENLVATASGKSEEAGWTAERVLDLFARASQQSWQPPLRRRAADVGNWPRHDDQPKIADFG
jgi:branched-chain amino acid transport system ATP-binding protein